jgi:hypothetical protein
MEMSMIFMQSLPPVDVRALREPQPWTAFPDAPGAHRIVLGNVPALGISQVERAVDQPDMGEGLGKIAEERSGVGVDLFGKQSDMVGIVGHGVEDTFGLVETTGKGQDIHKPEGAQAESAFPAGEPVVGMVAVDQAAGHELLHDPVHGPLDARVLGREKLDKG